MVQRIGRAFALGGPANNDPQLDLVDWFLGYARRDTVERTGDARRLLIEPGLLLRRRDADPLGPLSVFLVVYANRKILARPFDRREQPDIGQ